MSGHKSVIELLAELLAAALERIEVLEAELACLKEAAEEASRVAIGPKQ